jgi:ankyrin repeat protein/tetratricopeptide (TPR) repeat protein
MCSLSCRVPEPARLALYLCARQEGKGDGDDENNKADRDTKKKERKKKKQRDPDNPNDDGEDSDEIDTDFGRDGQIVVKVKEDRTEMEIKLDESRPPSRPVSATLSERNAVKASAVAAALENAQGADAPDEPSGPRKMKRAPGEGASQEQPPADLSGPQRFLVTIDQIEELRVDDGHVFLRLTMGSLRRESKRYPCGDQLIQGVVKVWTGLIKINEEFYWEIGDNDAYVSCLLMHVREKDKEGVDLGEVKLDAKKFGVRQVQETYKFSDEAGVVKLKGSKLTRGGEAENEDDEQAIMAAMQKHSVTLTGTMRLSIRVIQAVDIPAMDEEGTSDPYLIITCGQMKKRSKVIQRTLKPQWHEDFDFFFAAKTTVPQMEIEMWDRDTSARDDFMGKASLAIGALVDLRPRQEWVRFKGTNGQNAGKVQIYMTMEPKLGQSDSPLKETIMNWFLAEDSYLRFYEEITGGVSGKRGGAMETTSSDELAPAVIKISVLRAKDLLAMDRGGTSDPYVRLVIGDDLVKNKKTTVKNKTLNPTWMENFELHIQSSQRRDSLWVEAFDKDLVGTDDSLGKFGIALDTIIPNQDYREWYKFDKDENAKPTDKPNDGQIELSYVLKEMGDKADENEKESPDQKGPLARQRTHAKMHREVKGMQVTVVGGRGMPKMDSGPFGKCDPYLKLRCGSTEHKTKVVKKTLSPTWNENFNFAVESEDSDVLIVECYDYDMVGSHDFIGSVEIKPKELNAKTSEWYKLVHPDNPEFHAEVFLTLIPVHESMEEAEKKILAAQTEAKENAASTVLTLEVVAAKGLEAKDSGGTSDPYTIVQVAKEKRKTKVIQKDLNPEWAEKFELVVNDVNDTLKVSVWDKDFIGSDDLIGETMIPLESVVGQKVPQKWYTLYHESRITGEIMLGMKLPKPEGYKSHEEIIAEVTPQDVTKEEATLNLSNNSDNSTAMYGHHVCTPPHVRVYISGTLSDLAQERHFLHGDVIPQIRRFCEKHDIFCSVVDVRMGMVSEDSSMIDICLQELDRCSIFLCFVGQKYGIRVEKVDHLLKARPWVENVQGKSIVEFEVASAIVTDPHKFHGRAFVYLRDSAYVDSVPGLARDDYEESDPTDALALEAFKKRLNSLQGVPVVNDYVGPESVMKQVSKDLLRTVKRMYADQTRKRLLTLQRATLLHYCADPVLHYFLDSETAQQLNNYVAFDDRTVLNIVGPPGSGKTSLLRTWGQLYEINRCRDVFFFIHFDLGASGVESAKGILRRILFEMKAFYNIEEEVPNDYIQIKRTFLLWLRMGIAKGGIVIVIDGADGFDEPNDGIRQFLDCIPKILPGGLRLILSMETGASVFDQILKKVNFVKTLNIGTLSMKARKHVCESMLLRRNRPVEDLEERIIQDNEMRNPLRLRVAMEYFLRTNVFLPGMSLAATFDNVLELIEKDFWEIAPGLVKKTFTCIARSRRGMTDTELMSIGGVNRITWARFIGSVEELLDCPNGLMNFIHGSFDDAICKRYFESEEDKQKVTVLLSTYFSETPLSFRKIEEYPWLLAETAQYWFQFAQPAEYRQVWRNLRNCLVDIDFFQAMYRDQFVSDLHDFWHQMADVFDLVHEYEESIEKYASKSGSKGATDRIIPAVHVATCQTKLARFFYDSTRFEAAERMYLKAIETWKGCPGKLEQVANITLEMGKMQFVWGRYEQAEETLKDAVGHLEKKFGMNNVGTGKALFLIADALRRQKKEAEGLPYCERAFQTLDDRMDKAKKECSPLYARCTFTLGVLFEILEKNPKAIEKYERCIPVFAKALGTSHPEYCQALECLAGVYKAEGELSKAAACYQTVLPIKEEMSALGASLGDVTTTQNNLAAIFVQQGDLKAANVMYRKTVKVREHQFGHTHVSVARSLEMLANTLSETGDLKDAAMHLQRALNIRTRIYGAAHIECAATMLNLSTVQCRRGQFGAARELFKKWLKVMLAALGASHPTSIWALNWLDRWPEGGAPGTKMGKKAKKGEMLPGGKMSVNIIRARGLKAMDSGGTSDPYVVVQFSGQSQKTWPKIKTLNPEWNEKFEFKVSKDDRINSEIVFQCFDKDIMGDDDDMGKFTIKMMQLPVAQAYRVWKQFDDAENFPGDVEIEILLLEDNPPGPKLEFADSAPRGTLIEQMEEKQKRDTMRDERAQKAADIEADEAARNKARARINKASLKKIEREKRREAKIAAGLWKEGDPDDNDENDFVDSEPDEEEKADELEEVQPGAEEAGETKKVSRLLGLDTDAQTLMEMEASESEAVDEQGATRLHYAAMWGKEDKITALLAEGADPNVKDKDGLTPLHYAVGDGHVGIMPMLIDKGAMLDVADKEGDMVIHISIQEKQQECLSFILMQRPDLINVKGAGGNTALHLAAGAEEDNSGMVRFLLANGADAFIENEDGYSALDLAQERNDTILNHPHYPIIRDHLGIKETHTGERGAPLKPVIAEKMWAFIEQDELENVLNYLSGGLDVDGRLDANKTTSLMLAISLMKVPLVKELVDPQWDANVDIADHHGRSALHFCALLGETISIEMLDMLLQRNPNLNLHDIRGYTPFHFACERCPVNVLQMMFERATVDALAVTEDGHTSLHLAALACRLDNVKFLIDKMRGSAAGNLTFVDEQLALHDAVNRMDNKGNTALHLAARSEKNKEICKIILEAGGNARQVNKDDMSALDVATKQGHGDLINLLAAAQRSEPGAGKGADLARELMMLTFAIKDGNADKVHSRFEQGFGDIDLVMFLNLPSDEVGDTLLHKAAAQGHADIIKMLVDKGAYVHATNELRCTPLHAAAMHGQAKAIEYLLERGADPRASDSEGYCPMHYAAGEGHVAAVDSLVTKGFCDETLKTFQGLTVLHIAVTEAQENMVNYLLQRKPELASIPDSDGVLPIQYAKAADDRNEEIVNLLAVGDFFPQNDSIMLALHTRSPRYSVELYLASCTCSTDRSNVSFE